MTPVRSLLLFTLIACAPTMARADDPWDLLMKVRPTISSRLPLLYEGTLQVLYRKFNGTIHKKCCRLMKDGSETEIGQTQAWNLLQDDVPPFLVISNELDDPFEPVPFTGPVPGKGAAAGAPGAGRPPGTLRALGKETIDGVACGVIELSQTSEQIGELSSISGPFPVKRVVRKFYIGQDGLVHRIVGEVSWMDRDNAPVGKGATDTAPLQTAQFVMNVTSYRKAVTFALRPNSQPPTQSMALKKDGDPWPPTFAISQDGRLLALGSQRGDIHLVDAATSQDRAVLVGHPARVTALAFSPDATRLASADSLAMALWNVQTGKLLYTLHDQPGIVDLTFAPDGKSLLVTAIDGLTQLRDVATGKILHTFDKRNFRYEFTFSPDGAYLAGISGYDILLWNTKTWEAITVEGNIGPLGGRVAFSPDSSQFAEGGYFGVLTVWDTRTGHKLHELKGTPGSIGAAWFSSDGRTITALDADNRGDAPEGCTGLTTWDTTTWQVIRSLNLNGGSYIRQRDLTSAGNTFIFKDRIGQLDEYAHCIKFWPFPILPASH